MKKRKIGGSYIPSPSEPIKVEFNRITLPLDIQVDASVELNIDPNKILFTLVFDDDGKEIDSWEWAEKERIKNQTP